MIKTNNLDIARIFYNNIDISDLYYNQEHYFKRCVCDGESGGGGGDDPDNPDTPDNPTGDFGEYINTYNSRELMMDSIDLNSPTGVSGAILRPRSLYKYTVLDDCFVYNVPIPVAYMHFNEHDNIDSRWFIPLVYGNELIDYVDVFIDHNLVKRAYSLEQSQIYTQNSNIAPVGYTCNFFNTYYDCYYAEHARRQDVYGIHIDYADVVNTEKHFSYWNTFRNGTYGNYSLSDFDSYNYSNNYYSKAVLSSTLTELNFAFSVITINVKYSKRCKYAYLTRGYRYIPDTDKNNEDNIFLYYGNTLLRLDKSGGGSGDYSSMAWQTQINYPINIEIIARRQYSSDGSYTTFDNEYLSGYTSYFDMGKRQLMIPPLVKNDIKLSLNLAICYDQDIFCLTERPLNISIDEKYLPTYNFPKDYNVSIYCKEQWKDNYILLVDDFNNNIENHRIKKGFTNKGFIFTLKTF